LRTGTTGAGICMTLNALTQTHGENKDEDNSDGESAYNDSQIPLPPRVSANASPSLGGPSNSRHPPCFSTPRSKILYSSPHFSPGLGKRKGSSLGEFEGLAESLDCRDREDLALRRKQIHLQEVDLSKRRKSTNLEEKKSIWLEVIGMHLAVSQDI